MALLKEEVRYSRAKPLSGQPMTSDLPSESSSDEGTLVPCHGERFNCLESSKYSSHWQGQKTRLGSPSIRIGHARRNAEAESTRKHAESSFCPTPSPSLPEIFQACELRSATATS